MWTAEKIWPGETVFILAAGPSTRALDLSSLEGRRVIAVKSAWKEYPKADVLFFADGRWWREKALRPGPDEFAGLIVTSAKEIGDPRVKVIGRAVNARHGFATRPDQVALERSSTTGAINLAIHFGAARIALLGVDAKIGVDGRRHNHGLRWPWPPSKSCWKDQINEFAMMAPSAAKAGVEIVNANPDSAVTCWPRVPFDQCIEKVFA
ncbi:hypothetical protein [Mesorhizobium sp. M2A.F.Ca.ET.067.02.1.1]|uniref:hypothetical protein n=1 Tax=Mesorhizobium sp. M2A.F.Ca.ET.067.02.1.1 TaxID=2496749 RepID=UPI000FD30411|nr:hypothetical protein [Mesorhizobium sp. M2A.F.Ca.ET.067.02.1.1]RUW73676.1 hypothetical protein EOA28_18270 [Mesorhizobium sp. M2A.F.Ca.ET.067.02.1.1]